MLSKLAAAQVDNFIEFFTTWFAQWRYMKPPLLLYIVVLAIVAVVECAECGKVSMRVVVAHMVAVSTHKLLLLLSLLLFTAILF